MHALYTKIHTIPNLPIYFQSITHHECHICMPIFIYRIDLFMQPLRKQIEERGLSQADVHLLCANLIVCHSLLVSGGS